MALTDATRLADFSSGVGTDGTLDTNNLNVSGVTTAATLKVGSAVTVSGGIVTATTGSFSGTVTANAFSGDGSELTGVSGFATALSSDQTSILNRFFKTPEEIPIGAGTSVSITSDDASGNVAFVREGAIHVAVGATFHVGSGTTLVTNVLGVFS
jgi:hypothetical protein